jgi:hypothetical protein
VWCACGHSWESFTGSSQTCPTAGIRAQAIAAAMRPMAIHIRTTVRRGGACYKILVSGRL